MKNKSKSTKSEAVREAILEFSERIGRLSERNSAAEADPTKALGARTAQSD